MKRKRTKTEKVKRGSSERSNRLENMWRNIQISPDIFSDCPLLHMYGQKYVRIENYRGIMDYEDTYVKLMTKKGVLMIAGKRLEIAYCSDLEICIAGYVTSVQYMD